jgi:hypothetical protein
MSSGVYIETSQRHEISSRIATSLERNLGALALRQEAIEPDFVAWITRPRIYTAFDGVVLHVCI